jgi:peptidoglycan/LPS O-acetylase OafA/YrhL
MKSANGLEGHISVSQRDSAESLLVPDKTHIRTPNNFDLIRMCMAMLVVWSHSFALYRGSEANEPLSLLTQGTINSGNLAVLVFFMISGFLITQSFDRSTGYWGFLKKRVARIHPGFIVATSICAFVVIPLYSRGTAYTLGTVGRTIGFNLLLQGYFPDPTPFTRNPVEALNGSLWSIPFEFWCYLGVFALGGSGFLKPRLRPFLICVFIMLALVRCWLELTGRKPGAGIIGQIIGWPYTWFRVLPCFLAGMLAYQYRDRLPRSLPIALLGPVLVVAAVNLPVSIAWKAAILGLIFPPAVAYSLFYFAFKKQLLDAARFGDFSYGTYLYAFPIQQMLRADFGTQLPFWLFIPIAMILSLAAGVLSWHCVERWFQKSTPREHRAASELLPKRAK